MKIVFSAVVSVVLLLIYAYLVWFGIDIIINKGDPTDFNDRMASSLALISGLVSALVIAELSVTNPGEIPAARLIDPNLSSLVKNLTKSVTALYLVVWLITGFCAFFFGYLTSEPGTLDALSSLGQAWLGIAVGAGYAYFGIKPSKSIIKKKPE